jgi:hypothetical protein
MLYTDDYAQVPLTPSGEWLVSTTSQWLSVESDDIMVVVGKGRFKCIRVLHPVHGPCRVQRERIIGVINESR